MDVFFHCSQSGYNYPLTDAFPTADATRSPRICVVMPTSSGLMLVELDVIALTLPMSCAREHIHTSVGSCTAGQQHTGVEQSSHAVLSNWHGVTSDSIQRPPDAKSPPQTRMACLTAAWAHGQSTAKCIPMGDSGHSNCPLSCPSTTRGCVSLGHPSAKSHHHWTPSYLLHKPNL